ncbi:hypothetical protein [Coleofasciculus sp. E1-EBD-02]|uniref:hypothetical protein n=1 Tax=Coleofasciculus sp. E1-EBD-02 TaxID=3068481 RepID=UPI0032FBF560
MLHLGEVQKNDKDGSIELQLLARQESDDCWAVINPPESISLDGANAFHQGSLVLVDMSDNQEVLDIQSAKEWVLNFVHRYLTIGITPMFLQEEVTRTEQWRQDLTLQSQDLTRQRAEMEARRENIQALEIELKLQQQDMEKREAKLQDQLEKYNITLPDEEDEEDEGDEGDEGDEEDKGNG